MQSSKTTHAFYPGKKSAQELVASLSQELHIEKTKSSGSGDLLVNLKDALHSSGFQLKDVQGEEEVKLTRNLGNETVDVLFSIAALSNLVTNPDSFAHDPFMCKSDGFVHDSQWGGAQAKNASSQGAGNEPENRIFPTDGRELMGDEVFGNFPVTMNIIVKKDGVPGILAFDVVADDGDIRVLRMCHYSTKKQGSENAVAYSPGHRATYNGPPYGNLDEDLQRLIEEYLRARGIDATLARWVPEYVDFKEQREYVEWLSNVKSFMEK